MAANITPINVSDGTIKALDTTSIHRISSGQVVIDLQTAVKEPLENSLDAGATSIEVRFKDHGIASIEVIDNGSGIPPEDYDAIALKHHTSKLTSFDDLASIRSFGFRGEALSSLCAVSEKVTVTTATAADAPMGTIIEFDRAGRVMSRQGKVARQRGTTIAITGLFTPLPVRRKELERNAKREFGKALTLLSAYALVPCALENKGVRLSVIHQSGFGKKSVQMRTDGTPSTRASVSALWGPKALEHLVELDLRFDVEIERAVLRRQGISAGTASSNEVRVRGLISKFSVGCGRTGTDRQFFFINGRPCNPSKVQKAFNEVYRTFNATQAPFIVADFIIPTDSCDVNVSPDKRTILLHSENNLVQALKVALEQKFSPARATYDVNTMSSSQTLRHQGGSTLAKKVSDVRAEHEVPLFLEEDVVFGESSSVPVVHNIDRVSLEHLSNEVNNFGDPILLEQTSDTIYPEHDFDGPAPRDVGMSARSSPGPTGTDASQSFSTDQNMQPRSSLKLNHPQLSCDKVLCLSADEMHGVAVQSCMAPTVHDSSVKDACTKSKSVNVNRSSGMGDDMLSDASKNAVEAEKGSRTVQTTLSTASAAWNLKRPVTDDHPPRLKRRKFEHDGVRKGQGSRQALRATLQMFASDGTRTADAGSSADRSTEGEQEDDVDELQSSSEMDGDDVLSAQSKDFAADEQQGMAIREVEIGRRETDPEDDAIASNPVLPTSAYIDLTEVSLPSRQSSPEPASGVETNAVSSATSALSSSASESLTHTEIVHSSRDEDASLRFSWSRVSSSWERLRASSTMTYSQTVTRPVRHQEHASIQNAKDDEKATKALALVIDKSDFASMEIVGQFNFGFIVVRKKTVSQLAVTDVNGSGRADDLFIVDQHAADEKYNFETLQQMTKIKSQRLFRPQPLELTAADELVVIENMDVLQQNGFEVEVNEPSSTGGGHRLQLVAQPMSRNVVFDYKDLEELLHLLRDRPAGQMVRCSKARAMFAMRACRKSIMVGTALDRRQMVSVIHHMGEMDQPWHCPHGRPTMRHLADIRCVGRDWWIERRQTVDWTSDAI